MDTDPTWFTGQLLLALPGIGDPRFEHSVIAMISHDEDGAMGIGIADPIDGMTVGAVLDQLEIGHEVPLDEPVYLGGPVEPSRGFVLHSLDWGGENAVQVGDRWMVSSSHDILRAIGEGRGPSRWLVALGYAGWSPGQLEGELVEVTGTARHRPKPNQQQRPRRTHPAARGLSGPAGGLPRPARCRGAAQF